MSHIFLAPAFDHILILSVLPIFCYIMMLSSLQLIGDVELTNMQLKPEALNSLKLPVRVKAGFLGSVKLKVCSNFFALVQMQNCFAVFVIL